MDFPRHVHRAGGEYLRVEDAIGLDAALADGWLLMPPLTPEQAAERHALQLAAGEITESEPAKVDKPEPTKAVHKRR
jgi:hypothetical protein